MAAITNDSPIVLPPLSDHDPYNGIRMATFVLGGSCDADTTMVDAYYDKGTETAGATANLFSVPDGAIIHDFGWRIREVWTAGCDWSVGDCEDAAGYASVAEIGCTGDGGATDVIQTSRQMAAVAGLSGSTYAAFPASTGSAYSSLLPRLIVSSGAAYISIVATHANTEPDSGLIEFYVWYSLPKTRRTT